jgi:hypothetical protein
MRSQLRKLVLGLAVLMGLAWASDASAALPAGGSRLLFYFSNKSFVSGSSEGSAFTLAFLTNGATATATKVAVKYYRGDNCQETSPVIHDLAAGQTLVFDSSVQVPTFPDGVMEAFFVNGAGQPVRFDFGVGSSAVVDKTLVGVARLSAAALHSDNRAGSLNTVIADNSSTATFAPLLLAGSFPDPSVVTAHLALFAPGTAPGTVASDRLLTVNFRQPSGGGAVDGPLNIACGRALPLSTIRGLTPAQFQAAFPGGGVVAPSVDGQEKGVVGWKIETVRLAGPIDLIFGERLEAIGVANDAAHP